LIWPQKGAIKTKTTIKGRFYCKKIFSTSWERITAANIT
jgi:hypothetical protein